MFTTRHITNTAAPTGTCAVVRMQPEQKPMRHNTRQPGKDTRKPGITGQHPIQGPTQE